MYTVVPRKLLYMYAYFQLQTYIGHLSSIANVIR